MEVDCRCRSVLRLTILIIEIDRMRENSPKHDGEEDGILQVDLLGISNQLLLDRSLHSEHISINRYFFLETILVRILNYWYVDDVQRFSSPVELKWNSPRDNSDYRYSHTESPLCIWLRCSVKLLNLIYVSSFTAACCADSFSSNRYTSSFHHLDIVSLAATHCCAVGGGDDNKYSCDILSLHRGVHRCLPSSPINDAATFFLQHNFNF